MEESKGSGQGCEQSPEDPTAEQKNKKSVKKENPRSWILSIVLTIAATLLFCNFVARPSRVIGISMQNTCQDGDMVMLWELNYQPQHGDIVVVNNKNILQENLIKRVIAVSGDHITVYNGSVTLNGQKLTEDYIKEQSWEGADVDMTVPQGRVFLMGDNRNHSTDSRQIGAVSTSNIIGKVAVRFFPFTTMRTF